VGFSFEQCRPEQEKEGIDSGTGLDPALNFNEIRTGEWNRFAFSSGFGIRDPPFAAYAWLAQFSMVGIASPAAPNLKKYRRVSSRCRERKASE
jgi:hypothetical protein